MEPARARQPVLWFPLAMLVAWSACLLLLPSQLIVRPVGAPGAPAGLIGLGLLLWWALASLAGRSPTRRAGAARVLVTLMATAVVAAYVNGNVSGWYAPLSLRQDTDAYYTLLAPDMQDITNTMISAADRGMLAFLGWMGVLLVAAELLRGWRDLERVVVWLVGFGAVVAVVAIAEFVTGISLGSRIVVPGLSVNGDLSGVMERSVLNRVSATAIHPIELGVVLACLFPLALHRLLFRRRPADFLATGLIGLAALLTVSRSAIVCLVAAGLVLWVGWPGRWKLRSLIAAPFLAFAVRGAVPGLLGTIRSLFANAGNDPSVTGRTADYGVVLDLYADHPWLGRGLFTFVPRNYRILDNQWLMVLVELGAIGLLVVLVLAVSTLVCGALAIRRAPDFERSHLSRALLASVTAWLLGMATFDTWTFPMGAGIGFLMIGLCLGAYRLSSTGAEVPADAGTTTAADRERDGSDAPGATTEVGRAVV